MCSLPFFTYGIALGDEVATDETLTIDRVGRRSGPTSFASRSSATRLSASTYRA
jgi:hypothetical protein